MSDLDDELLAIAGRKGRGSKGGKRGRRSESEEDDWEDDDDDDEEYVDSEDEKPAKRGRASSGGGGRRRGGKQQDDEEEEEDDEEEEESDDEEKLAGMNELDRELYLFERDERRAREQEKRKAMQEAEKARKTKEKVEVRASTRRARPATGADGALDKLTAARQQRQQKEKRVATTRARDEEEEGEGSEDKGGAPSGEASADSDRDEGVGRYGAHAARGYDEGGGEGDEDEEDEENEPADLEAVLKIQLKRDTLEQWFNQPFFEKAVRGCVVRLLWGNVEGTSIPNYMMMRVVEVVDKQPYRFTLQADVRTNKWLVLDDGMASKAVQMSQVSTKDIAPEEFERFNRRIERGGVEGARKISRKDAAKAEEQIKAAISYKFTTDDIKKKLAARREKGELVGGVVQEKARVRALLEAAQSANNYEAAAQFQAKLDELEAAHAASRAAAASANQGMAKINARNKTVNFEKALRNVGNRPAGEAGREGGTDVFSRRQTQSKVYWQTGKKGATAGAAGGAAAAGAAGQGQQQQQQAGQKGGGAAATHRLDRTMSSMDPAELIPLLDLDLDFSLLPNAAAISARRMLGGGRWQPSEAAQQLAAEGGAGRPVITLSSWLENMQQQQQQQ